MEINNPYMKIDAFNMLEEIEYEDMLFPVIFHYDCLGSKNFPHILMHWHKIAEVLYFKKGSANLICNQSDSIVKAGDIAFIAPYCLHKIDSISGICEYYCFSIDLDILNDHLILLDEFPAFRLTTDPEITASLCKIIKELEQKQYLYQTAVKGEASFLFGCLIRATNMEMKDQNGSNKKCGKVHQIIEYIYKHFHEKITMKNLAEIVELSEAYLSRYFHETTGSSVTDFLVSVRCRNAYHLISSGKYNIGESAEKSGFNNKSYFTKKFKEIYGIMPSEIKRGKK